MLDLSSHFFETAALFKKNLSAGITLKHPEEAQMSQHKKFIGLSQPAHSRKPEITPVNYSKGGDDFRCPHMSSTSSFGRQILSYQKAYGSIRFAEGKRFASNASVGPGPATVPQVSSLGKQLISTKRGTGALPWQLSFKEFSTRAQIHDQRGMVSMIWTHNSVTEAIEEMTHVDDVTSENEHLKSQIEILTEKISTMEKRDKHAQSIIDVYCNQDSSKVESLQRENQELKKTITEIYEASGIQIQWYNQEIENMKTVYLKQKEEYDQSTDSMVKEYIDTKNQLEGTIQFVKFQNKMLLKRLGH